MKYIRLAIVFLFGTSAVVFGANTITLTCEKPIPYSAFATPNGDFEMGYYVTENDGTVQILEQSTSTPYSTWTTKEDAEKRGYVPMVYATKYAETCSDGTYTKQYDATSTDYDTYSKDNPRKKTENALTIN